MKIEVDTIIGGIHWSHIDTIALSHNQDIGKMLEQHLRIDM